MSQDYIIDIQNLTKVYGSEEVLSSISLKISRGEIFTLLGSDSSGKTSLIEILEGLRKATSGEAFVLGFNIKSKIEMREIKKKIGALPQEFNTHNNLTVKENIMFWGKMYDQMVNPQDLMQMLKLEDVANKRYKNISNTNKRKVGIATALVSDPEIIFLDEPTAGLDYYIKKEIWEILLELKKQGKTIVLTSNDVLEPQAIADRVAILHQGIIKDIGSPRELIERYSSEKKFIIRCPNKDTTQDAIKALEEIEVTEIETGDLTVSSDEITLLELLEKLEKFNVKYSDIITQSPSLNDAFLSLTGVSLRNQ